MLPCFKRTGWIRWLPAAGIMLLSLLPPVTVNAREGWQEEYLGEWILDEEEYSTLTVPGVYGETVYFSPAFFLYLPESASSLMPVPGRNNIYPIEMR